MTWVSNPVSPSTRYLFITGCYRSGTTLLEKLMHSHPNLCVASQPFPVLYFMAKQAFLDSLGLSRRYPLSHQFLEQDYSEADFIDFLEGYQLDRRLLDEFFERLEAYSTGHWTRSVLDLRGQFQPGLFFKVYQKLNELTADLLGKPQAVYKGSKEILCEEFLPFLLSQGVRCALIIRDPRDMITSLDFRQRDNLTGDHRPLLYSLRLWRKSVAYALAFAKDPHFHWVRYEDLVQSSSKQLAEFTDWLGVKRFADSAFVKGVCDQEGRLWRSNSSFADQEGISCASVGRYQSVMPSGSRTLAFIESLCAPEMRALGYELCGDGQLSQKQLREFKEPFALEHLHVKFPPDYSRDPRHASEELERRRLLEGSKLDSTTAKRWFIYTLAYEALKGTLS